MVKNKGRFHSLKRPSAALLLLALSPGAALARGRQPQAPSFEPNSGGPSYIVVDTSGNQSDPPEILAYQPDLQRRPASLTKLMTIYLMCQTLTQDEAKPVSARVFPQGLNTMIPISKTAAGMIGSSLGLKAGSKVDLRTLALGMMTISANDAATAVGEAIAGKGHRFSDMMNAEANRLGMLSSKFIDATGQDILPPYKTRQNISTAHDIALLAASLYKTYGQIFSTILHPAALKFAGRDLKNLEKDVLGCPEGPMGKVVMAKGGINIGGHDSAVVMTNGTQSYVMVILGAANTPSLKSLRVSLFKKAEARIDGLAKKLADLNTVHTVRVSFKSPS